MEIIKAESVIRSMWEQFFGHNGLLKNAYWEHSDLALHFQVEISINNYGYEKDGNTFHQEWERHFFRVVEIIVTSKHQVFVRTHTAPVFTSKDPSPWINTSNHDSCWHSDGLRAIWDTLMYGYNFCYDHVPEEHRIRPIEMHTFCKINDGLSTTRFLDLVRVKVVRDPDDRRNYLNLLQDVAPVDFSISLKEQA
jgi:hypothetical protein